MTETMLKAREVVHRVIELLNVGDLDGAERFIAPDAVNHAAPADAERGPAGFRPAWEELRTAFPDWTFRIDDSALDGDVVFNRYTNTGTQRGAFAGHPAKDRSFTALGLDMVKVRDGQVVEHWALLDLAAMASQLGW
jgi:steroid delta-isomerase-like uncharacterized protein